MKRRINSRAKGKRHELHLCKFLRSLGFNARRGQQFKGTKDSPDVVCDDLPNVYIECKARKAFGFNGQLESAIRTANEEAGAKVAGVFWKHRGTWLLSYMHTEGWLTTLCRPADMQRWLKCWGETVCVNDNGLVRIEEGE